MNFEEMNLDQLEALAVRLEKQLEDPLSSSSYVAGCLNRVEGEINLRKGRIQSVAFYRTNVSGQHIIGAHEIRNREEIEAFRDEYQKFDPDSKVHWYFC